MTLVISAEGKNFVVLGADSRGIVGGLERERLTIGMDRMKKIVPISKHTAVLTYGNGEFGRSLREGFMEGKGPDLDGVTNVKEELRLFCKKQWAEWVSGVPFEVRPDIGLFVGFIVAGLDQRESEAYTLPRTWSIESQNDFAPALHDKFWPAGINPLAMYILNKRYKEGMTVNELCTLVAYAISETASVDTRVGGPIRIAVIDSEGFWEIPEEDVKSMLEE